MSIPIDAEIAEDINEEAEISDAVHVEEMREESPKTEVPTDSEESQERVISMVEEVGYQDEDEIPRRNPVPDGSSEAMEGESVLVKPPLPSRKENEALTEASANYNSEEEATNLNDVSGTLPWEMYRYIKKEEREQVDSGSDDYDGQEVGDGMKIYVRLLCI